MELDDLKQTWKQSEKNQKPLNSNIMDIIQHKSYGPIAALKKRFKKQMIIIPMMLIIVINSFSRHHQLFTDVMFWCYIAFCFSLSIYFYFNYRIVGKMEYMDGMIKSNLERQVEMLEKRLRWHILGVRIALLFFIVLSEVLPYFQYEPMLEKWHTVAPVLRILAYAGLLALQYFASRALSQYKYGKHLSYLKELINEMQ